MHKIILFLIMLISSPIPLNAQSSGQIDSLREARLKIMPKELREIEESKHLTPEETKMNWSMVQDIRKFEKYINEGKSHKEAAAHFRDDIYKPDDQDRVAITVRVRKDEDGVKSFIQAQGGKIISTNKDSFYNNTVVITNYHCLLPIEAIRLVAKLEDVADIQFMFSCVTH
jgi:hypothetical protein